MRRSSGCAFLAVIACLLAGSCGNSPVPQTRVLADSEPQPAATVRHIRSTGTIQAVRVANVMVPPLEGPGGRLTLLRLVPNGSRIQQGDIIAEFDHVKQTDDARDALAKVDDLSHQIEQNRAQSHADAAKRMSDLRQAEADLAKAAIELRKGETLSEIDRLKNQAKMEDAQSRVESLKKSAHYHDLAEEAGLHILELQRDRQQLVLRRAQNNLEKLSVKARLGGMVAQENVWRNGSMGPMQEGDQVWPGQSMVRIFDPSDMVVSTMVSETDNAVIAPGTRAKVRLDAYPGAVFDAEFESASPVASADLGSPIKYFSVRFKITERDPRLLPDLSAAVEIEVGPPRESAARGASR